MIVSIDSAIKHLKNDDVVAIPTETVYGLAARIDSETAVKKIFSTKERPFFDPLIVHVASIDEAKSLTTEWTDEVSTLARAFWPGPLTLVLLKSDRVSDVITSGLPRVGIRMPNHKIALEIIERVGVPLAAPSANKFGKTSPTKSIHVENEFKKENVAVVEGGECDVGIESTVLLVKPQGKTLELSILRHGGVSKTQIAECLNLEHIQHQFIEVVSKIESPGHMKHHYMPNIPLVLVNESDFLTPQYILNRLNKEMKNLPDVIEDVKILKPKNEVTHIEEMVLSTNSSLAARELYAKLRESSEKTGTEAIYFVLRDYHLKEEWLGILDRLTKAASLKF